MLYWHGGAPGLAPGDWLLPRAETGHFRPYDVLGPLHAAGLGGWLAAACRGGYPGHSGRVYVTGWREGAWRFAQGYSGWLAAIGAPGAGTVYRVAPDGLLRVDPTFRRSWSVPRARIEAVEEKDVPADDSWTGQMGIRMMRDCYLEWCDAFNGGADHPMVTPGLARRLAGC